MARPTVVFDLDGTLVDTAADLVAGANGCLAEMGLDVRLDPVADAVTAVRGGRAMLRLAYQRLGRDWDDDDLTATYWRLLDHYEGVIDRESRPYRGAVDAVRGLRALGYATAVCTNKPERLSDILLTRLGLRELFDGHVGGDTLKVRKPDPAPLHLAIEQAGGDPVRSLLVGDTVTDRTTARAAGMASVLITFGPLGHGVAELEPEALLDDYAALPGVVAGLIG